MSPAMAVAAASCSVAASASPGRPRSRERGSQIAVGASGEWSHAVARRLDDGLLQVDDGAVEVTGDVGGHADVAAHRPDADPAEAGDGDATGVRLERRPQDGRPLERRRGPGPPRRGSRRR